MINVLGFVFAALPWILMGVSLAIFFAVNNKHKDDKRENYGVVGMMFGMCIGCALSLAVTGHTGVLMTVGMILGLSVGTCIKKDNDHAQKDVDSM